jgi:hypothetical protein
VFWKNKRDTEFSLYKSGVTKTELTFENLPYSFVPGESYQFRVQALNSEGWGELSDPHTITVHPQKVAPE